MKLLPDEMKIPTPKRIESPKAKRISVVATTGAALAVLWAGLSWAGVTAPEVFVSAVGTLAALLAGAFDV